MPENMDRGHLKSNPLTLRCQSRHRSTTSSKEILRWSLFLLSPVDLNWDTDSTYCKKLPSHIGQEQACSRITRLFGCSWPCRKWPNTQENGCCLPPSDHIQSKILFQTKQDQERGMNGPASLLHSWHWVLFIWHSRLETYCILLSLSSASWLSTLYYQPKCFNEFSKQVLTASKV